MLNNVSFGSNAGVFDKPNLTRPQTYTKPSVAPASQPPVPPEGPKKSNVGKIILGTLAAAAAVAGLLVAGNKTGVLKNVGQHIPENWKNAKMLQFAKEPAKKALAGMDKAGGAIADVAVKGYEAVKGYGESAIKTVKGWFTKAPSTPAP